MTTTKTKRTKKTAAVRRAYLVTTAHRGVFFGYADEGSISGTTITLYKARNCIYWSADVGGFLGLATKGPTANCKIGPAAESLDLRAVTSVALVSEPAVAAWERQ